MNVLKRSNRLSGLASLIVLTVGVVSILSFQSAKIALVRNASTNLSYEQTLEKNAELQKRLKVIKSTPSFGFRNSMADGVFLNFLQYFSSVSEQSDASQSLSADFFEVIIALDPFYRNYYLFLSTSTTFYAAQPQKTVDLMARGLTAISRHPLPDSFYIWRYKGVDELLFLANSHAAQKSFERAAEWAERSDEPDSEAMGRLSRQTADFLASDPESTQAQISAWGSILSNASNDTIRDRAVRRIQELGGRVDIQEDGTIQISIIKTSRTDQPSSSSKLKKTNG